MRHPVGGPESPYFGAEFEDEDLYPERDSDWLNQEGNEQNDVYGDLNDCRPPVELHKVINMLDARGQATGQQIVDMLDVLLSDDQAYDYSVKFWKLPDEEELPEWWNQQAPPV